MRVGDFLMSRCLVGVFDCEYLSLLRECVALYIVGFVGRFSTKCLSGARRPASWGNVGFVIVELDALTSLADIGIWLVVRAKVYLFIFSGLSVRVCLMFDFVFCCLPEFLFTWNWCFAIGVFVRARCVLGLVLVGQHSELGASHVEFNFSPW